MKDHQQGFQLNQRSIGKVSPESRVTQYEKEVLKVFKVKRPDSESHHLKQIQDLDARNHDLETVIETRNKELTDLKAIHAKSISIIAHDLRSPFHSILGALEMVKSELGKYPLAEIEEFIDLASVSAHKTLNLLEVLLTWSISQRHGLFIKPDSINLSELIQDEIKTINILLKIKKISLDYSASDNVKLIADLQMVRIIIRNLISNAVKYTHTGGKIRIRASEHQSNIIVEVKDNGIGISPVHQKDLFSPGIFQSTPGTLSEIGTGLGLSVCKELVEMHGGKIWVESTPGCGSKFRFSIPQTQLRNSTQTD
jgi:signal transduction histidine kinase